MTGLHEARARRWDAIILGAGPAGALTAARLAARGLAVLLLERSAWPRDKVCGCCLSPGGVAALHAGLGDADARAVLADSLHARTLSLRIGSARHDLPIPEHRILRRSTLDARLVDLAVARGARFLPGTLARVAGDHIHAESGADHAELRARAIIAADGLAGSSLRDCPWAAWRVAPASRLGAGAVLDAAPLGLTDGTIAMHIAPEGYAGLVRLPGGGACIALAGDAATLAAGGGPGALARSILTSAGADPSCIEGAAWRGTPPLTRRRPLLDHGNVLILGDAAGYVEPFTGEGMTWALQSALAAEPFILAVLAGARVPGAWTRAHARLHRTRRLTCSLAAGLARRPRLIGALAAGLSRSTAAAAFAGRLFAGRPLAGSPA